MFTLFDASAPSWNLLLFALLEVGCRGSGQWSPLHCVCPGGAGGLGVRGGQVAGPPPGDGAQPGPRDPGLLAPLLGGHHAPGARPPAAARLGGRGPRGVPGQRVPGLGPGHGLPHHRWVRSLYNTTPPCPGCTLLALPVCGLWEVGRVYTDPSLTLGSLVTPTKQWGPNLYHTPLTAEGLH